MSDAAKRLIVALDCTELRPALAVARQLRGLAQTVKVGSVLFTACGPEIIRRLQALGFQIMLDLKWFDIPSTVELSCRAAVDQRVALVTVHTSGGSAMLAAAVHGMRSRARQLRVSRPRVLGVTVLTSVARGIGSRVSRRVLELAGEAVRAGCDGLVASAQEVPVLRQRFGARPMLVCPGIRPAGAGSDDQRRVATPAEAIRQGADALVIGRPITAAPSPREAAQHILSEMLEDSRC